MQLSDWLTPLAPSFRAVHAKSGSVGEHIRLFGTDFDPYLPEDTAIALVGVPEDRCTHGGEARAVDGIRQALYDLSNPLNDTVIVDLGNIKAGHSLNDTYYAVDALTQFLQERRVLTVLIGGSCDVVYGALLPAVRHERFLHWTSIHPHVFPEDYHHPELISPLSQLLWTPSEDWEYTQIGYQSYFVSPTQLAHAQQYYDTFRLGVVKSNVEYIEPYLRDSHVVSLSMTAVRHADAPDSSLLSPNGFPAEDVCHMGFFAGTSTHCMVFGVFDALLRGRDETNGTVSLAAQAVWHFLQGVSLRVDENPIAHPEDFQKYIVSLDNSAGQELYFLKSLQTGRWWLATPQQDGVILKVTACSKTDYEKACNNEIPDRWCKLIQR